MNVAIQPWRPMVSPTTVTRELNEVDATLEGTWPEWVTGTLMRTAPAVFEQGPWRANHWFDGLGMMFSYTARGGKVRFRQRLLESDVARSVRERGRVEVSSFGGVNQRGFFKRLFEPVPRTTDNTNVNVLKLGDAWHVYTETNHQLTIDEPTLESRGEVKFADELSPRMTMTAHPHWDFEKKRAVNAGVTLGKNATVRLFDYAPGELKRRVFGRLDGRELSYMHSFGMTEREAIVVAHPWVLKPHQLLWSNKGFGAHFAWKPERGSKILVFDKSGNEAAPKVFETETVYVFHVANAFADGEDRVIDVLSYPDPGIMDTLLVQSLQPNIIPIQPALLRIRLKANGSASIERLLEKAFELPAISYRRCNGKRYRYLYGSTLAGDGAEVVKLDLETGEKKTFGEKPLVFGEPVFVARPGAQAEDDGVVLTVGSSATRSTLVALDGRTFEPVAQAKLELPIPLGFHGSFVTA